MGYSVSKATSDRISQYAAEDRWCQGSGRCSTRAQYVLLMRTPTERPEGAVWQKFTTPGEVTSMVTCTKHFREVGRTFEAFGMIDTEGRQPLSAAKMLRDETGQEARSAILLDAYDKGTVTQDEPLYYQLRELMEEVA